MSFKIPYLIFFLTLSFHQTLHARNLTPNEIKNCKLEISQKLYYTLNKDSGVDYNAVKVSDPNYAKKIGDFLDYLPEIQKKVLCNVTRIQIHQNLKSVAYASVILDENRNPGGNLVGLKAEALKTGQTADLFSWKEQLSFGQSDKDDPYFSVSPQGPQIKIKIDKVESPEIFYVLVHELNHLIDFMNGATNFECSRSMNPLIKNYSCQQARNTFGLLSFPEYFSITPNNEVLIDISESYPLLSKFCFYNCQNFISLDQLSAAYKNLANSPFVSTYSTTHMAEDFAEFATAYLLNAAKLNYEFKIYNERNEVIYDQKQHLITSKNQKLRLKKQWIQDFFNNSNLKYKW